MPILAINKANPSTRPSHCAHSELGRHHKPVAPCAHATPRNILRASARGTQTRRSRLRSFLRDQTQGATASTRAFLYILQLVRDRLVYVAHLLRERKARSTPLDYPLLDIRKDQKQTPTTHRRPQLWRFYVISAIQYM